MQLTRSFKAFFESERSAGLLLIACTGVSLVIANSKIGQNYSAIWHGELLNKPLDFWINDVLMSVFFLLVGLEIAREIRIGELAEVKSAMLPVIAALGGMIVPALIHFGFNHGTNTEKGFGIPMATDIAFSLGVLSLVGKTVPASLKVFLTALAIIDDLGAILVIAIFYSEQVLWLYLFFASLIFAAMVLSNRKKVHFTWIYLLLGAGLWYCLYCAGVHPTISGVLLAFVIPFGNGEEHSPSFILQKKLHGIVAFFILPVFAIANTAILIPSSLLSELISLNSLGIILGLIIGKPLGIFLFSLGGKKAGFCELPSDLKWSHIFGAGTLAGIGFTMSVFISMLAFNDQSLTDSSKIAIIVASLVSGLTGYLLLRTVPSGIIVNGNKI